MLAAYRAEAFSPLLSAVGVPFRCNLLNHLVQSGELGNGLGCRREGGT